MSTTYTKLVEAVKGFANRTDTKTIAAIPMFIAAAQTRLDGEMRIPLMTRTTTHDAAGLSISLDVMEIETVVIGGLVSSLMPYDSVLRRRIADFNSSNVYAINGNSIELVAPAQVIVTGYQKPPRLSDAVQTNAYTDHAENALLWQSLVFLSVFTKDTKGANGYQSLADAEIANINAAFDKFKSGSGVAYGEPVRKF
ncbi:phage adaptor protein [Buttiauxella sp.]|uniref:phage adaptor protein n=1 Tax=Buttiauxella sp. TaxID=1972222 RepID=UPI003C77A5FD